MLIHRDNPKDFLCAADMACRVVQAFVAQSEAFESQPGLPLDVKAVLAHLIANNKASDDDKRLKGICEAVSQGKIPGLHERIPVYVAKGMHSWKFNATGIRTDDDGDDRPGWSDGFETSDYRRFHDAVKEHRFVVTQTILPAHGLRIA
jgi:hypothetical protein